MENKLGATLARQSGPVMLTGHTGFKGTWLTLLLENLGIPVVGYSLPPSRDSLFNLLDRQSHIPEIYQDIRNTIALEKFVVEHRPSVIFHLAAQPLVLESYSHPSDTFQVNVQGTVNLLNQAAYRDFVKVIAVITTDKVYKNTNLGRKFIETDPLEGKDPYSASKVGAEAAVAAWQNLSQLNGGPSISSYRAGNVVGGGDSSTNRLLPDLIRGFRLGKKIEIRNPLSTRPWQHVLDPLVGYILACEDSLRTKNFENYNFGPDGQNLTVYQVADIAAKEWGAKSESLELVPDTKLKESVLLDLDSNKAKNRLGWFPNWSQEESVKSTINWWKNIETGKHSPLENCLDDISRSLSIS